MASRATQGVIQKGGMPGEVFPTLGHPPRCVLMGGEHPEKPIPRIMVPGTGGVVQSLIDS